MSVPPRAAYVHVPFCVQRCGYCNFTVVADRDDLIEKYLTALERELGGLVRPRGVDTLYVGGGTPTQLGPGPLRRLGELLRQWFPVNDGYEMTIEANPNDLTDEMIDALVAIGVNRLSVGAQSFNRQKLLALDRHHTARDVEQAVVRSRDRIANISLDLIFAAPGETIDVWRQDLGQALALGPAHLSTYGLTYERGARFWGRRARGELAPVNEETERAMYVLAIEQLAAAGMEHYEVSNFARHARRCRHNEAYWSGAPYFAAGPGAARYVDGCRETNHRSTYTYIKRVMAGQSPVAESQRLAPEDRARERLVFGLRMLEGVDADRFASETGYRISQLIGEPLRRGLQLGLLQWTGRCLQLTRQGLLVSDSLWPDFLWR